MNTDLHLTSAPVVHAGMVIRRARADVFDAFTDIGTIQRFWVTDTTGALEPGARVTWTMNAAGAKAIVEVREFEPGVRLGFAWGDDDAMSEVDFQFSETDDGHCRVDVKESGFEGTGDELAARAADSTGGFTMVLCSLKALLEHDIVLRAVSDRLLE